MRNSFRHILILLILGSIASCALDEPFHDLQDASISAQVEFVARPINFIASDVSTKAESANVKALENDIYTAYFLLYDTNGRLLRYKNLTQDVKDDKSLSQTIVTDKGLTNVTACYIANLPESFLDANKENLQKLQSATIEFKTTSSADYVFTDPVKSQAGFVGVPAIDVDGKNATANVECIPMFGSWTGNLAELSENKSVEIPIKRLFSKVSVIVDLAFEDELANASLTINSLVVNNIPRIVSLFPQDTEMMLPESENTLPYLSASNFLRKYNEIIDAQNVTVENNSQAVFSFYVPEYIVEPAITNSENLKENYKPTLIGSKKATYVVLDATLFKQGQELNVEYKVYLGENEVDNFTLKRNHHYSNYLTIENVTNGKGGLGIDHRVEINYDGFLVGFQRATLLDSHFEVRPLRVQFSPDLINDNKSKPVDYRNGVLTVEILNADTDDGEKPDWIRLERPTKAEREANLALYCPSGEPYPTKRRYFTTDLLDQLENNTVVSYNPFDATDGDLNGEVPVWVYVDEYLTESSSDYAEDAVRIARIRVTYTPNDPTDEPISYDFTIEQRAIYPITSVSSSSRTYGIEFFEEYQHDYDSDLNYEDEGGVYYSDYNGMQWGLDGITLSRNNKALYVAEADPSFGEGTDPKAKDGFDQVKGILSVFLDEIMSKQVETLPAFYDYYAAADDDTGIISNIDTREYEGYEMNVEIIHHLLEKYSSDEKVLLNGFALNKSNPLSAIAYCYNKNKRDENGNVVTLSGDNSQTVNIENLHWYAPCIEEIEDIMTSAYDLEEEFYVFTEKFYWSCQPAYHRNRVDITYKADVVWGDTKIVLVGWIPTTQLEESRPVKFVLNGSGPYFLDDDGRARATRFDPDQATAVSSSVDGYYAKLESEGYNDFGYIETTTAAAFYTSLANKMRTTPPTWTPADPEPEPTGEALTYHEGNDPRFQTNRIRCIYNPNPPKTATRTADEDGSFTYTYAN